MKPTGLSQKTAQAELKKYGYNEITEKGHLSIPKILLRQTKKNFILYLLSFAALISFFVGKSITGYAILFVIFIVIAVGFIQEYRAEKAIKALRSMIMPMSVAVRDGKETEIESRNLVPGDIIILRTGEKVPADCVILEAKELTANESVLTGESKEVKKLKVRHIRHAKKENMLYMGTFVTSGRCVAKVMHTGMNTEFGKIAGMISTAEKDLPLREKINKIAQYMSGIAATIAILTGIVMLSRLPPTYENIIEILIVVIALSVSAFPEGFPVVLITTLAGGAYKMAKRNAIVNRLSIIETLGETTIICSDKTGTITKGEMTARNIYTDSKVFSISGSGYSADGEFLFKNKRIDPKSNPNLNLLIKASILCNDSHIERKGEDMEYKISGSATEGALLIMAAKAGLYKEDMKFRRIEEMPFTSERKSMAVVIKETSGNHVYVKGAPEIVLKKCKFIQKNGKIVPLGIIQRRRILKTNREMTSNSLRTLALAYKKNGSKRKDAFWDDLIFIGLVGMEDPPREEVKDSIKICKTAGIKVKMITGDNKETATKIAKEIGIIGRVMEGEELDKITDEELSKIVNDIAIFARVKPEHKIKIVRALKANGEIVTMTGDGVNDAPALKEAHIGVAMGKTGTDVSRDVSDLVLKDDNFSTIVTAVEEGRNIFNNIRRFVTHQLSCNFAELMIIFIGIILNLPLPLLALQILLMNLVTDDITSISLGFNPSSKSVMRRNPRKDSKLLTRNFIFLLLIVGVIMGIGTLAVYTFVLNILGQSVEVARTTALMTLIFFEIFNTFNFRSFTTPMYKTSLFYNKYLVYAAITSLLISFLVIYTPINRVFEVVPIHPFYWMGGMLVASSIIFIMDTFKIMNRRNRLLLLD